MADHLTPERRSWNMSQIHSKDTAIEVKARKWLYHEGFRYRKNVNELPGKPDVVLKKYKTVIFIHGCFWHKHEGCKYFVWPKSNIEFWEKKIYSNAERDKKNYKLLEDMGWNVIVIWECELKKKNFDTTMARIVNELTENYIQNLQR